MTKKLFLIPLLVAPLFLASCGESNPGAFEQGDNILNAELIREVVEVFKEEDPAKNVVETKLTKQLTDAEGATLWSEYVWDSPVPGQPSSKNLGFIIFKQAVTVETVTTTTYEVYSQRSLKLVATWTETNDPASMVDTFVYFSLLTSDDPIAIGYVSIEKEIYVMKNEVRTLDRTECVAYDQYGHKLVEYSQKNEPGAIPPISSEPSVAYENYDEDTYLNRNNVVVLTIQKWTKDHYEDYRYVYSEDMQELKAESEADMFPHGVFEPIASEFEVEGVKYTVTSTNDYEVVVYKDGVEDPVCKIPVEVYRNASSFTMLDEYIIYVMHKEVASTSENFTYLIRGTEGIDKKFKQEVHKVNLLTGEDKTFEPNYVVGDLANILPLEEADVGYISVVKTREDKTIDPLTQRVFLIDSDLVFHDDVTNSPLASIVVSGLLGYEYPIEIVGSNYYDRVNDKLLDENLEPISSFALAGETSYEKVLGELIVVRNNRTNLLGLFDKEGKEIVPFILKSIGSEVGGVCVVTDVVNGIGFLDTATGVITWLDFNDQIHGSNNIVYVKHNVAAEGEPEELHYKTYYAGKLMGDFDHKVQVDVYTYFLDANLYRKVTASETDLSSSVTFTLWEIK